ncbi:nitroreductase family protein, partial [Acidomonas methanolica]|uniref:nitroreductase family protein n=1 Tax=Acidomonas methanolica TaxID=437 RepID=UPI00222F77E9
MTDSATPHSPTLSFLLSRVSCDALAEPAPDKHQIAAILSAGLRAPDHGKLRPWRYVVIKGKRRAQFAELVVRAMRAVEPDISEKKIEKRFHRFSEMPMTVVLGMHLEESGKIPVSEQEASVAAGAMNVLNALHAEGFGGMWVSGDYMNEPEFRSALGLGDSDRIAGFIFVGTPTKTPHMPRRPEIEDYMAFWTGEPVSFRADKIG